VSADLAAAAACYARHGWAVFPCFTVEPGTEGPRCSCGNAACASPGKHPIGSLVPHGVSDAQADERAALEWWSSYHDANIGIATGDASGILVVDVDPVGLATVADLERRYDQLPATWAAETGSGGIHLYYRMPDSDVRNSAGAVGLGVDIRANGGYVVAPPSRHLSGRRYGWSPAWHPRRVDLAGVPDWLLGLIAGGGRLRARPGPGDPIPEGARNAWLAALGGAMRRVGGSEAAIVAALTIENRSRCRPPLADDEVERVARSVGRYEPEAGAGAPLVAEAPSGAQFFGGPAWRRG
jgi:hypothetical protein